MKEILHKLSGTITGTAVTLADDAEEASKDLLFDIAHLRHCGVSWGKDDPQRFRAVALETLDRLAGRVISNNALAGAAADDMNNAFSQILAELRAIYDEQSKYETHSLADPSVREAVWNLTGGNCSYCGSPMTKFKEDGHSYNFCVEHVVPRSQGGPDNLANYVPSCMGCNNAKKSQHVLEFIQGNLSRRPRLVAIPKTEAGAA